MPYKDTEQVNARQKAYYEANKEKVKAYSHTYKKPNKELIQARQKAYYDANKDKIKANYEAHKDEKKARRNARYDAKASSRDFFNTLAMVNAVSQ